MQQSTWVDVCVTMDQNLSKKSTGFQVGKMPESLEKVLGPSIS